MSRTTLTRIALMTVLAAALIAQPASADMGIDRETVEVDGAQVQARMIQARNGGVYAKVLVRDTKADGVCAHGTIGWHHVSGQSYYDYGMWWCGAGTAKEFTVPVRDWRAYERLSVGAFVDNGGTRYETVRRWDRATLKREADRIMRMRYREFDRYKRFVAPWPFDWSDDGCSGPTPQGWRRVFRRACEQHDFGYRNYGKYLSLGRTDATRGWIDDRFKREMTAICVDNYLVQRNSCLAAAHIMYAAVRAKGRPHFYG
jgi:Prokaryotic phospholipase A2